MDYLKVEDLKPGYLYRIKARNGTVGVWDPDKGEFLLSRLKFGSNFVFGEVHWDLDPHFGTVKPLEELEESPFDMEDYSRGELLKYLNKWEHKLDVPHPKERP